MVFFVCTRRSGWNREDRVLGWVGKDIKRQEEPCETSAGVWLDDVEPGVELLDLCGPVFQGPLGHVALPLPEAKLHRDKRQERTSSATHGHAHDARERQK